MYNKLGKLRFSFVLAVFLEMVFSSTTFLFFFLPVFLLADLISNKSYFRNALLIFTSLLFYVWGEATGVFLLVILAFINLLFGRRIANVSSAKIKKIYLVAGIFTNLTVLFYFKYLFWVLSQFLVLFDLLGLGWGSAFPNLDSPHLPLGISFFVFHGISYLIDLYNRKVGDYKTTDFLTYFFMFPHLVAGPIVRFESVRQDIQNRKRDWDLFTWGVFRFILGINKKVLIANSVAPIADICFYSNGQLTMADAWLGALAYTVQIYFDFSGYSDMAIGLAAMMGIRFQENFLAPYRSQSIKEFWRRWHVSLSTWFRDYLYFPLGGSRCSKLLTYRNLVIVFVLCGLWHGAQWTFLIWGLFHGCLLILERTSFATFLTSLPVLAQRCYCMLMVVFGWVFFRANDLSQATSYFQSMFGFNGFEYQNSFGTVNLAVLFVGLAISLCSKQLFNNSETEVKSFNVCLFGVNVALVMLSMAILYTGARNPFIYFNF